MHLYICARKDWWQGGVVRGGRWIARAMVLGFPDIAIPVQQSSLNDHGVVTGFVHCLLPTSILRYRTCEPVCNMTGVRLPAHADVVG